MDEFTQNIIINDSEISPKKMFKDLQFFWRKIVVNWRYGIAFSVLGCFLGLLFFLFQKPLYKAELNFILEDNKLSGLGAAAGLASQFGLDLGGSGNGEFSEDNILEILKSRVMVEKTLLSYENLSGKPKSLINIYIDKYELRKKWKAEKLGKINFDSNVSRSKYSRKQDSLLGDIYKRIVKNSLIVDKLNKKASIISVKTLSQSDIFSKLFTITLVSNVSNFYIETKTKKEIENVGILQHQVDSVRGRLNYAIYGVASSLDLNPNLNANRLKLRVPSQKYQIDVQANTAILMELVKNLEISKLALRKDTPLIQILDTPILPLEDNKVGLLLCIVFGFGISFFCFFIFLFTQVIYDKIIN